MKKLSMLFGRSLVLAVLAMAVFTDVAASDMYILYKGNGMVDMRVTLSGGRGTYEVHDADGKSVRHFEGVFEDSVEYISFEEPNFNYRYTLNYWDPDQQKFVVSNEISGDMSGIGGTIYLDVNMLSPFGTRLEIKNRTFDGRFTTIKVSVKDPDKMGDVGIEDSTIKNGLSFGKNIWVSAKNSAFEGGKLTIEYIDYEKYPSYQDSTLSLCAVKNCTFKDTDITTNEKSRNILIENSMFENSPSFVLRGVNHKILNNKSPENAPFEISLYGASNITISGNSFISQILDYSGTSGNRPSDNLIEKNKIRSKAAFRVSDRMVFRNNIVRELDQISGDGNQFIENQIGKMTTKNVSNLTVRNNTFDVIQDLDSRYAVLLKNTDNENESTLVEGNMIRGYGTGIASDEYIGSLTIKKNTIAEGTNGIDMLYSSIPTAKPVHIENNSLRGRGVWHSGSFGIQVGGLDNIVAFNLVTGHNYGIVVQLDSKGNGLHENIVENNSECGILLYGSNNWVFNNIIRSNNQNAKDLGTGNLWNREKTLVNSNIIGGSYLGGNKWGNYTGTDPDGDGLGNTPYPVYDNNGTKFYDNLPLVEKSGYNPQNISVSPSSLISDSMCAGGSTDPKNLTVTNTGGTNLVIDSVSLTGADAYQYAVVSDGCSGKTLASSQTCPLSVAFSPKQEGGIKSSLKIISDDPDSNIAEVLLTGNAAPASNLPGDVNGDCKVDLKDEILTLQVTTDIGVSVRTEADVNGDGKIGQEESAYILQKVGGLR